MKSHRRNILIFIITVIVLTGGYFWFSYSHEQELKKDNARPQLATTDNGSVGDQVATVQTVPIKKTTITENITVYGTVIPAPGAVQTVSVPFESRIRRILVSNGQRVSQGEILLEIEPSQDTYLQIEEARNAAESLKRALKHVQQRFDLKLAINEELLQAKQASREAQLRLESLERKGVGQKQQIRATAQGVVNKVSVQESSIVSAGSTLLEVVPRNRVEVRLGVEPEDMKYLRVDQPFSLSSVNTPESRSVIGRIRAISQSINPTTRLIDVFVELPPSSRFLLDEYVRGKMEIASKVGVVVPRTAVLPEEDGHYVIFTVKDGHAKKHTVQMGLEDGKDVEVIGSGFQPGDLVVILGKYELKDGMAVKVGASQ
jgi:membrane fusion protein (multidrug efflux system)